MIRVFFVIKMHLVPFTITVKKFESLYNEPAHIRHHCVYVSQPLNYAEMLKNWLFPQSPLAQYTTSRSLYQNI